MSAARLKGAWRRSDEPEFVIEGRRTQGPVAPLPTAPRSRGTAARPHRLDAGRRPPVVAHHLGPLLQQPHDRPLEAAIRGWRVGRPLRAAARYTDPLVGRGGGSPPRSPEA